MSHYTVFSSDPVYNKPSVWIAPINRNLENVPGVAYYETESKFYNQTLVDLDLDSSVEGLPRPVPLPDDGGDDGKHQVDADATSFQEFVEHHKTFLIIGLIIFIILTAVLGVAFYIHDRKRRKDLYNQRKYSRHDSDGYSLRSNS